MMSERCATTNTDPEAVRAFRHLVHAVSQDNLGGTMSGIHTNEEMDEAGFPQMADLRHAMAKYFEEGD